MQGRAVDVTWSLKSKDLGLRPRFSQYLLFDLINLSLSFLIRTVRRITVMIIPILLLVELGLRVLFM